MSILSKDVWCKRALCVFSIKIDITNSSYIESRAEKCALQRYAEYNISQRQKSIIKVYKTPLLVR